MAPTRMLVVYGSETGNVRRGIHFAANRWQGSADHGTAFTLDTADILTGNEAAAEFESLWELQSKYDVLIVATSSFGEGDPPKNFLTFLVNLIKAVESHKKPFEGMQHAVIGFGQSVYPTYQNTPRYVDKLLEALGSRRMVRRVELDEGPTETIAAGADPEGTDMSAMSTGPGQLDKTVRGRQAGLIQFASSVQRALKDAPGAAKLPPVCPWTEPDSSLYEKSVDELLNARPQIVPDGSGLPQWAAYVLVAAVAAGVTHMYHTGQI